MENEKIGRFICALRKEKGMTQKELAERLGITDKAVSKWERGLSCPDISLLPALAGLLGVSVGELLGGERSSPAAQETEAGIDMALSFAKKEADDRRRSWQTAVSLSFSLLLLVGAVVCSICDVTMNLVFTWSLYPIASSFFAWLVLFPLLWLGVRGIWPSLLALSLAILPFLAILDRLIEGVSILPVGVRMALLAIGSLWAVFALFRLLKSRWLAAALALLLMILLCVLINLSLRRLIGAVIIDAWDILVIGVLAISAAGCFAVHIWKRGRQGG